MDNEQPATVAPVSDGVPVSTGSDDNLGKSTKSLSIWAARLAARYPGTLLLGWGIALLLWVATIPAAFFLWIKGFSPLWAWASDSFSLQILAAFASLFMAMAPFWVGMIALGFSKFLAGVSTSPDALRLQNAKEQVRETEHDAIVRLEDTDKAGLLPLLRYSRAQLDEYYEMGLAQTKRSFFHALIAMWLGFILLILGLALYVGPVEKLGIQRPSQDFNVLILSTAAIIEFISVLFLWIYRSTMGQLTFYYRLQIRNHNSILCFRMTTGMKQGRDEATAAIVTSMLDSSLMPERTAVEGSGGLRAWFHPPAPPPTPPPPPPPSS